MTHTPAFALLYEPYDKPVLVVNSCRYEQPFGFTRDRAGWEWLNAGLQRMSAKGQLALVSNNKADAEYLVRGTGLRSTVIPSLCLYTCASHTPVHSSIVEYGDRGFFPPCARLVERPASGYSWSTLYSYAAIVHVPYEMSTMSLFEQYSAGVPLFLPSRAFYSTCIRDGSLRLGSIYGAAADAPPALAEALTSADFWLSRADYYDTDNFRGVYFYESREDLVRQVSTFEESATVKAERLAWIASRAERVLDAWRALMFRWWFGRVKMEDL